MSPTVGRIVHYYDPGLNGLGSNDEGPYAAIITHVHDDSCVDLTVFPSGEIGHQELVVLNGHAQRWEWPKQA